MQGVLKIMVELLPFSYAGQLGMPEWFGFPVRAKFAHALLILVDIANPSGISPE
jgi:hypothetical protein